MRTILFVTSFAWLVVTGCTDITPVSISERTQHVSPTFTHDAFDRVLRRFVDAQGRVDYVALQRDTCDLEQYYAQLHAWSPDSHPEHFPTEQSQLAYWINAYNASAMKIVLTYYPIMSVEDVKPPFPFFFLPQKSGFFLFQRVTFGGKTTSLYSLENGVMRKRFEEPRIHFALNCASRGCPRLPQHAFTAERLDVQLDTEAQTFVAEEHNVRIDHEARIVYLSSIFNWYKKDFLTWYRARFPDQPATLLHYVALYQPTEQATALRQLAGVYDIRFVSYDWRLNDQNGPL